MPKYDFFIAGRWRNKDNIEPIVKAVRESGKSAYCFIENEYQGEKIEFKMNGSPEEFMRQSEALAQNDPLVHKIFETDLNAQKEAENFLLVLPAGNAGHIEAGISFGMGKKCYAIGKLEKTETLYCIFDEIFPDVGALKSWLREQ